MHTIKEARDFLAGGMKKGERCPCCGQFVKMYELKLVTNMARALIVIYEHSRQTHPVNGWIHIPSVLPELQRSRAYPKLAHWKLLEQKQGQGTASKTSGEWRITLNGKLFVEGGLSVPESAFVYDGNCYGNGGRMVTLADSIRVKFSYQEIMK